MSYLDPSILTSSPPVSAMCCEPMTTAEIDAHPDAPRIWATIMAIRFHMEAAIEQEVEARLDGEAEG